MPPCNGMPPFCCSNTAQRVHERAITPVFRNHVTLSPFSNVDKSVLLTFEIACNIFTIKGSVRAGSLYCAFGFHIFHMVGSVPWNARRSINPLPISHELSCNCYKLATPVEEISLQFTPRSLDRRC